MAPMGEDLRQYHRCVTKRVYKPLLISYTWVNQQHNGANRSLKPLNLTFFMRKYSNKVKCAENFFIHLWGGLKLFWMGPSLGRSPVPQCWAALICGIRNAIHKIGNAIYKIRNFISRLRNIDRIRAEK